ncbi:DUF7521 family protein [Haladaptatus sp. NG-SE-30]
MHIGLVIAKIVVVILGFLIAFQSYRAYKRYDSRPMFLLAVGFFTISIGAVIEGVLYDIVKFSIFYAGMVQSIIVAIGICLVLYSIYYQAP